MSTPTESKDERINLRLKQTAKMILERAARYEGQTVSKFVLNSALECAEKTIQQHDVMSLNRKESEAFFYALAAPAKFNTKLLAALKEHEQRVKPK